MNRKDYCSYELSKALKACGFDEPCDHVYCKWFLKDTDVELLPKEERNGCHICANAPTLWQAQKWLREKKKIHCQVLLNGVRSMYFWQVMELVDNGKCADSTRQYDVYEDAMGDCISAALELINKGE